MNSCLNRRNKMSKPEQYYQYPNKDSGRIEHPLAFFVNRRKTVEGSDYTHRWYYDPADPVEIQVRWSDPGDER